MKKEIFYKKSILVKPIRNKKNGQVNISLPKKKLPKKFSKIDINPSSRMKIIIEDIF